MSVETTETLLMQMKYEENFMYSSLFLHDNHATMFLDSVLIFSSYLHDATE